MIEFVDIFFDGGNQQEMVWLKPETKRVLEWSHLLNQPSLDSTFKNLRSFQRQLGIKTCAQSNLALSQFGFKMDSSNSTQYQEKILHQGLMHAKEHYPLGSDEAIQLIAHVWAALFWQENGEYELALEEIEKALFCYRCCERNNTKEVFNGFASLLRFHKGILLLYLGKYPQAEQILQKEYEPYNNLGQTVLYRLVEQKINKVLLIHPERLKKQGCLSSNREIFHPDHPQKELFEKNVETVNEAVYIALRGKPQKALEMYHSLHLDPIEEFAHRRHYAAIQALNGDLQSVTDSFEENVDPFGLEYADSLEYYLLYWLYDTHVGTA